MTTINLTDEIREERRIALQTKHRVEMSLYRIRIKQNADNPVNLYNSAAIRMGLPVIEVQEPVIENMVAVNAVEQMELSL
jgi:hypothetical protein